MLNFGIGELTVFLKDDVETQAYYAQAQDKNCKKKKFHPLKQPFVFKAKRFLTYIEYRWNLGSLE